MNKLQTTRLAQILHLLTSNAQYGYKSGIYTLDSIVKIEHAIVAGPDAAEITLVGLSKAFIRVNRTPPRGALYKHGLPISMINHIKQGHQNTTLRCKDNGEYGTPVKNNVWVYQGSAISALLLTIYMGDMMLDYQAPNDTSELPRRMAIQPDPQIHTRHLLQVASQINPAKPHMDTKHSNTWPENS